MKKVKLDKQILEKYLDLEKQIRQLESKNVLKNYEMKQNQLRDFEDTVKVYEQRHQECIKRTWVYHNENVFWVIIFCWVPN